MEHFMQDDLFIEDDDDIFFGLPEYDIDLIKCDFIWDQNITEEERAAQFEEAGVSSSKEKPKGRSKSKSKGKKKDSGTSKSPRLQCHHCTKTYANERTLKTHLSSVAMKDVAARAPDIGDLSDNMRDLCVAALKEVRDKMTVGDLAEKCSSYVNQLAAFIEECDATSLLDFLAEEFSECFQFSNSVFVSKLRDSATAATNGLIATARFRNELKEQCTKFIDCPTSVLNFFIGNFIFGLSNKVLIYAVQKMQNQTPQYSGPSKKSRDDFSSSKFKQLVHYIGGSVLCGVNRRRKNYPTSTHIKTFTSVMDANFMEDKMDESTWGEPEVKEWTIAQDRGGLVHISKDAFNFFYGVICLAIGHEEDDGSLYLEKVNASVSKNQKILSDWDLFVGTSIEENESLEWLACVVDILCRCISKGIIKRRLNIALQKPVSNVAHRPKLAR